MLIEAPPPRSTATVLEEVQKPLPACTEYTVETVGHTVLTVPVVFEGCQVNPVAAPVTVNVAQVLAQIV
jgi:hypothetical protein